MKKIPLLTPVIFTLSILCISISYSQNVGINDNASAPDSSAILDINSSNKGVLLPRLVLDDASTSYPVSSPAEGLIIYNDGGTEPAGYYFWTGNKWSKFAVANLSGITTTSQIYGEMYEPDYSTSTSYSLSATYTGWTSATEGNVTGAGYCTYSDNITADRLTIETDGAGVYKINVNVYFEYNKNNTTLAFTVFKNGTEVNDLTTAVITNATGDERAGVITGLIDLVDGDYLDLRFKSNINGTLQVFLVNFSINRI